MLPSLPRKLTPRLPLLIVAVVCLAALAAACGSDPEPTPTPDPTPTATPTATPVPTPTPTPEPVMAAVMIDEGTLGRDIIGMFNEDEATCIRDTLGDSTLAVLMDTPVMTAGPVFDEFPFDCLAAETGANLAVGLMAAQAGGLTAETASCLRTFIVENGVEPPGENFEEDILYALEQVLCFTDEEAAALMDPEEGGAPLSPSQLRCVSTHTELSNIVIVMTNLEALMGGTPSPEFTQAMGELFVAFGACGIDPSGLAPAGMPSP